MEGLASPRQPKQFSPTSEHEWISFYKIEKDHNRLKVPNDTKSPRKASNLVKVVCLFK